MSHVASQATVQCYEHMEAQVCRLYRTLSLLWSRVCATSCKYTPTECSLTPSHWPVSGHTLVRSPLTGCFKPSKRRLCCACRRRHDMPDSAEGVSACLSAALVAYGLESFVDLWASVLVLWRFWEDEDTEAGMRKNHDREARADVGIAFTVSARSPMSSPTLQRPEHQLAMLAWAKGLRVR